MLSRPLDVWSIRPLADSSHAVGERGDHIGALVKLSGGEMARLFGLASCGVFLTALAVQPVSADWRVRINGVATPYLYDGSSFRVAGPDVPIAGSIVWQQQSCDSSSLRGFFQVTKADLDIDNGRARYACDETDPGAINWHGSPEGACDYGTNMLDFGTSTALVRGLAAPPEGPSAGDAATDLSASFTGGSFDAATCAVEPPSSADLQAASIMTHAYTSEGTVTTQYVFTSGTLTFDPAIPSDVTSQIAALLSDLEQLGLDEKIVTSLTAKLNAAITALAEGASAQQSTCGLLRAFSNHAHAQSGKDIPVAEAAQLVARASTISHAMGCR
jgi:hypothetical protein